MHAEHSNLHFDTPFYQSNFSLTTQHTSQHDQHVAKGHFPCIGNSAKLSTSVEYQFEKTQPWLREITRSMKLPDKKPAQFLNTRAARRGSHNCEVSLTDTRGEILFGVIPSAVPDLHSTPHKQHYTGIFKTMGSFLISVYKLKDRQNVSTSFSCYLENLPEGRKSPRATIKHGVTPEQGPGSEE